MTTTPPTDTAAALWSAIDAYGCDAASHGALGKDATTRAAIDRAITAHVEAEVARRLAAAPDVEAAIETHGDACYERGFRHAHKSEAVDSELDAAYDRLRAAIAADKARAVEAEAIAAIDEFRRILTAPRAAGVPCPVCKVARPTPDEARSIGRVAEHLRGLAAEVEPSRMADGFEADRMRLLAHRLRQVAALMPDTAHVEAEVARRLAAAPEVEAAIETHGDACYERGFRHALKSDAVDSELDAAHDRLRAAIAADKARAVEAAEDAAFIRGRDAVRKHPEGWGLVARPTPDEARRLVEAFAAAHGALVLLMHGGQYDPFDDEGTRRSAADTARTALLRALGVEA